MAEEMILTVRIHDEGEDGLWAEVEELPGCFASGFDPDELKEALLEAISMYLSTPQREAHAKFTDGRELESVREERVLVDC
jgi:predicted RNase H-like HicB family nuclease